MPKTDNLDYCNYHAAREMSRKLLEYFNIMISPYRFDPSFVQERRETDHTPEASINPLIEQRKTGNRSVPVHY